MNILTLTNISDEGKIKVDIDAQVEFEQAIKRSQTQEFKLIKRESKSQWYDLLTFKYSSGKKHYGYNDFFVENNTKYEYAIKLINSSIEDNIDGQAIIASFKGDRICDKEGSIKVQITENSNDKPYLLIEYHGKQQRESISRFLTDSRPKILKDEIWGLRMVIPLGNFSYSIGKNGIFKVKCIEIGDAYDISTLKNNGLL